MLRHYQALRELRSHLERAGLPRIRFHDLRHTAATLMLRAGVPIPTASHVLAYKNPTETLNRYARVLEDMEQQAALIDEGMTF